MYNCACTLSDMTTTQTTQISPLPDFQPVRRSNLNEIFVCKDCASHVLWKESRKTGKTYLAVANCNIHNADGRCIKTIYPAHKCVPTIEAQQSFIARKESKVNENERAINAGEIVKGQTVEVFKGRKYAKGLTGLVFWVATEPDRFDVTKIGMTSADGEKVWINIDNVRAVVC